MVKQYFKYFKWFFIVSGVIILFFIGNVILQPRPGARQNTECVITERVFDYGDVLTDEEEENLRKLIAKRERQTGYDILLVTLNESLKEYAMKIDPEVSYEEFVAVYAEEFYDDNKFGYNKPIGDGVLLVDNWFREDNGKIYSWVCAVGEADLRLGVSGVEYLLDKVYEQIEQDPYKAYQAYVEAFYDRVTEEKVYDYSAFIPLNTPFMIALVVTVIYIVIHLGFNKGKKTITATTYVNGGNPYIKRKDDILINKVVTKRHIEVNSNTSYGGSSGRSNSSRSSGRSSGGGSPGRTSGGGGRHGGGGRSR